MTMTILARSEIISTSSEELASPAQATLDRTMNGPVDVDGQRDALRKDPGDKDPGQGEVREC